MIATSSAFQAANAALAKQPVYAIRIEGYSRIFTTANGIGTVPSLPGAVVVQFVQRGNGPSPPNQGGDLTLPNATPAGNILFAFMNNNDGGSAAHISDEAGNTWTALYLDVPQFGGYGNVSVWYAVAVAAGPGNVITIGTGPTGGRASTDFHVVEVPAAYSGFLHTHTTGTDHTPTATTSDGDTLSVQLFPLSCDWDLFEISLSPGLPIGFLCIGTISTHPADSSEVLLPQVGSFSFMVAGPPSASMEDWLVSIDDQKLTVSDLDGGADLADLTFTVQDRLQQLTADLATFTFEGKEVQLLHGFVGMATSDYAILFTGQIDSVDSTNGNLEYLFTASDVNIKKLTQQIFIIGDDGFATSSNHPKTIFDHPLNILVDALQQAGIDISDIDTPKIEFYRDTIYSGTPFEFNLTSPQTAKDFIENEIMKPLAMYLWVNNLGLVSINSFYPAVSGNGSYTPPTPPVMTAEVSTTASDVNQIEAPLAQEAPLVNQVIFEFDDDGSGGSNFLSKQVVNLDKSIKKYGLVGPQTIQSQGMKSAFQGYFQAALAGRLISLRYGFKNLIVDPLPLTWNACTLEPGDIIAVNNPFVPDRVAGVLGISDMLFEVLDRNWRFMDGIIEVKLLAIDFSLFKQYQIAPNSEADYASAGATDQGKYMFQSDATGKYSTGADANTLG
jgi:hypothetical protein